MLFYLHPSIMQAMADANIDSSAYVVQPQDQPASSTTPNSNDADIPAILANQPTQRLYRDQTRPRREAGWQDAIALRNQDSSG